MIFYFYSFPIAQLVEHDIGNLRITGSSPDMGTRRDVSPIHPALKWVSGIYGQGWHHSCLTSAYNGSGKLLPTE